MPGRRKRVRCPQCKAHRVQEPDVFDGLECKRCYWGKDGKRLLSGFAARVSGSCNREFTDEEWDKYKAEEAEILRRLAIAGDAC